MHSDRYFPSVELSRIPDRIHIYQRLAALGRKWKSRTMLSGIIAMLLMPCVSLAAEKTELRNDTERTSYSLGYQIGGDLKSQGVGVSSEAMVQGVQDALNNKEPLLSKEQMNAMLVELKKKSVAIEQAKEKQSKAEYRQASALFLKENAKKEGIKVVSEGLQYRVIKEGKGMKPTLKDEVKVNYKIRKVDGKEMSSTYDHGAPRTVALAKALPGLKEVLPLMGEGSKWEIFMSSRVASGGRDPLDDLGTVIYEMELLEVIPAKQGS